jgi:hypothetical protein
MPPGGSDDGADRARTGDTMSVPVTRLALRIRPDLQRLITKPYIPADHRPLEERTRLQHMLDRILSMDPVDAERTLQSVVERYADRHDDFEGVLSQGVLGGCPLHRRPGRAVG